ncbi:MAG: hypothetical protein ACREJ2_10940 [Planctomycetota bacterium]
MSRLRFLPLMAASAGVLFATGCVSRVVVEDHPSDNRPPPPPPPEHHDEDFHDEGEGEIVIREAPPPPRQEYMTRRPGEDYVWIPGRWVWNHHWDWVRGHWVRRPRHGAEWVPAHWDREPRGWVYRPGHWENR